MMDVMGLRGRRVRPAVLDGMGRMDETVLRALADRVVQRAKQVHPVVTDWRAETAVTEPMGKPDRRGRPALRAPRARPVRGGRRATPER